MSLLNTNRFGISDGFARAGEVALFHIASNAVVILGAALANYHPGKVNDTHYAYVAAAIAFSNMLIAGGAKWLTVHAPKEDTPATPPAPLQGMSGVTG